LWGGFIPLGAKTAGLGRRIGKRREGNILFSYFNIAVERRYVRECICRGLRVVYG